MGLKKIEKRFLVLCEGMHDKQFFDYLGQENGFAGLFQTASCGSIAGVVGHRDGISHLTNALNALPGVPGFYTQLEAVIIAADNDSDPASAFEQVRLLIRAAADISPGKRFEAPAAPLKKAGREPYVVVLMMPWTGTPGALDSLCHRSASDQRPLIAAAVDRFAATVSVDAAHGWSITKEHKMKLRSLISAAYPTDPYISPAWVWSDGTDLVPLTNPAFNQVAAFLQNFPTFLASP